MSRGPIFAAPESALGTASPAPMMRDIQPLPIPPDLSVSTASAVAPVDLRGSAVHVWRLALKEGDAAAIDRALPLLSGEERARADRFRSIFARSRFVLCRAALRLLLHRYLGGDGAAAFGFETLAFGKPILAGGDQRIHFNVSHTSGIALIALATRGPLGVDVERVRPLPDMHRLAERCFGPTELARLTNLPPPIQSMGFFQVWTRKEAFIKATGEGFSAPLREIEVSMGPGDSARFLRVPTSAGSVDGWALHSFEPAEGYAAAVAVPWTSSTITLLDFSYDFAAGSDWSEHRSACEPGRVYRPSRPREAPTS